MQMVDNMHRIPYAYNPSTEIPTEKPEPIAEPDEEEEEDPVKDAHARIFEN